MLPSVLSEIRRSPSWIFSPLFSRMRILPTCPAIICPHTPISNTSQTVQDCVSIVCLHVSEELRPRPHLRYFRQEHYAIRLNLGVPDSGVRINIHQSIWIAGKTCIN